MFIILIIVLVAIALSLKFVRDYLLSIWYCFKTPKNPFENFLGMIGFIGYYGQGKSLSMTHVLNKWRNISKKYKKDIKIYTNYFYAYQDGALESFADIEKICEDKMKNKKDDTYIIFAIDELQNVMNSRNWNETKKFETLMSIFTQTRKLKVMFLYTSPVASMTDKSIRVSSKDLYYCKKINRFFFTRWRISPSELEGVQGKFSLGLFPTTHTLLGQELKESYNSFDFVKSMSKKEYLKEVDLNTSTIVNNNYVSIKRKK